MATTSEDQAAANALLKSRMAAWAEFEDLYEPADDDEVAITLPRLLGLADALPRRPRRPLEFPPIAGGPMLAGR